MAECQYDPFCKNPFHAKLFHYYPLSLHNLQMTLSSVLQLLWVSAGVVDPFRMSSLNIDKLHYLEIILESQLCLSRLTKYGWLQIWLQN